MKRFKLGTWVKVYAKVEFHYVDNIRKPITTKFDPPIHGQIIGAGIRCIGTYHVGGMQGSTHMTEPDWEDPYLHVTGAREIWKVSVGMVNKPLEVLDADIKTMITSSPQSWKLPWKNNNIRKPINPVN